MAKANQAQPFRAKYSTRSSSLIIVVVISIFSVTVESVISDHHELELVIAALRRNNYTLFANAVATSDLSYTLSARNYASFTLFAPPDPYLFALDMVSSFHDYVRAIDLHVVHRRLPLAALVESDYLETVIPHHHIYVVKHEVSSVYDGGPIAVGGVRISTPDLFLGYSIAVHGLDGMIASAILSNEPAFVQWWCPYSSEQYFQNLNVNSKLVNFGDEEGINAEKNHSHFSKF
ncbi:hypothetical protein QQ045_021053 [Rhodiola kirilowii]